MAYKKQRSMVFVDFHLRGREKIGERATERSHRNRNPGHRHHAVEYQLNSSLEQHRGELLPAWAQTQTATQKCSGSTCLKDPHGSYQFAVFTVVACLRAPYIHLIGNSPKTCCVITFDLEPDFYICL